MSDQNHDEIMRDRKKAQHDLIELKKMQQGEIPIPPKPDEAVTPLTLKEKNKNFWFYNKYKVLVTILAVASLAMLISQCVNKEKFDCTVVLTMKKSVNPIVITAMEQELELYCDDYNGDGKVSVQILDCAYNIETDGQETALAKSTKYQAQFTSPESILYIIDQASFDSFDELLDGGLIDSSIGLPDCGGKALGLKGTAFDETIFQASYQQFDEDYYIVKRKVEGTSIDGDKNVEEYEQQATEILTKMAQAYSK